MTLPRNFHYSRLMVDGDRLSNLAAEVLRLLDQDANEAASIVLYSMATNDGLAPELEPRLKALCNRSLVAEEAAELEEIAAVVVQRASTKSQSLARSQSKRMVFAVLAVLGGVALAFGIWFVNLRTPNFAGSTGGKLVVLSCGDSSIVEMSTVTNADLLRAVRIKCANGKRMKAGPENDAFAKPLSCAKGERPIGIKGWSYAYIHGTALLCKGPKGERYVGPKKQDVEMSFRRTCDTEMNAIKVRAGTKSIRSIAIGCRD